MVVSEVHGAAAVFVPGEHQRLTGLVWRGQSSMLDARLGQLSSPCQAEPSTREDPTHMAGILHSASQPSASGLLQGLL